jgi:hypothetical protein
MGVDWPASVRDAAFRVARWSSFAKWLRDAFVANAKVHHSV